MESHCSVGINNHFWYLQSTFDLLNLSRVTPHLINWTVLEMRNFQAQRTEPQRHSCRLSNPNHHLIWVFQFHSAYKPYFVHRYKDTWGYRYPSCISTQLFLLTVHRHLPHCESSFCVIAISLLWALGLPFSSHLRKCSLHSEQGLLKERRRRTRNGAGGGGWGGEGGGGGGGGGGGESGLFLYTLHTMNRELTKERKGQTHAHLGLGATYMEHGKNWKRELFPREGNMSTVFKSLRLPCDTE